MNDPAKDNLNPGAGFPEQWLSRVEELLALPDDPRRHALVIFAFNLGWFYTIDPSWTDRHILSALAKRNSDSDAIWSGLFWSAKVPPKALYLKMKPALLELANKNSFARRQHSEILVGFLLAGWGAINEDNNERFITDMEMRAVLIGADDNFRSSVVWQLERWSSDRESHWQNEALLFLDHAWPQQRAAKSSAVSARLCELAFANQERFAEYVDRILPLVIPVEQDRFSVPSLHRTGDNIADKFPEKALALLHAVLPEDARKWPYGIDGTLDRIGVTDKALLNDERLLELKRRWSAR